MGEHATVSNNTKNLQDHPPKLHLWQVVDRARPSTETQLDFRFEMVSVFVQ